MFSSGYLVTKRTKLPVLSYYLLLLWQHTASTRIGGPSAVRRPPFERLWLRKFSLTSSDFYTVNMKPGFSVNQLMQHEFVASRLNHKRAACRVYACVQCSSTGIKRESVLQRKRSGFSGRRCKQVLRYLLWPNSCPFSSYNVYSYSVRLPGENLVL